MSNGCLGQRHPFFHAFESSGVELDDSPVQETGAAGI